MREAIFPPEVTGSVPRVTLTGSGEAYIEQHRGLITYQPEEVIFRTAEGRIRFTGTDLCFRTYTAAEAVLTGRIGSVEFSGNGGAGK